MDLEDDLHQAADVLASARIVALGEEVHGVGSFLALKTNLAKELIAHQGFTAFVLEEQFGTCVTIDRMVERGRNIESFQGLPLLWCWRNREVLDLVQWISDWNTRTENPVRFFGVDIQSCVGSVFELRRLADSVGIQLTQPAKRLLAFAELLPDSLGELDARERALVRDDLAQLRREIVASRVPFERSRSWSLARRLVRTIEQCLSLHEAGSNAVTHFDLRERFMAENFQWIIKSLAAGSSVVLSGHNTHVARSPFQVEGQAGTVRSLGTILGETYGTNYVSVGLWRNRGQLLPAPGPVVDDGPAVPGTVNAMLAQVRHPSYLVDLRLAPTSGPVGTWLGAAHPQTFGYPIGSSVVLRSSFDMLIYVDETRAPTPVR